MAIATVMLRPPTLDDQHAVMRAGEALARERGKALTNRDCFTLMTAQLADLPREAVLKFSVTDAQALAARVTTMLEDRGMV